MKNAFLADFWRLAYFIVASFCVVAFICIVIPIFIIGWLFRSKFLLALAKRVDAGIWAVPDFFDKKSMLYKYRV